VAVSFQAMALTRLIGGIADSNSAESMDCNILNSLCVVEVAASATSLPLVQRSPTGCVVCVCVSICV
jgi:hypothetical protein